MFLFLAFHKFWFKEWAAAKYKPHVTSATRAQVPAYVQQATASAAATPSRGFFFLMQT